MARIRTIKPGFWDDEKIGKLSPVARLLYIGTWNLADDAGILIWNPNYIKSHLFMYDKKITIHQVNKWMEEIASLGFIEIYTMRSGKWTIFDSASEKKGLDKGYPMMESYGFIKRMLVHQKINRPQQTTHTALLEAIYQNNSMNTHGTFTEDSLMEGEGEGRGGEKEGNTTTTTHARARETTTTEPKVLGNLFKSYESNIGQLTPAISERLKVLISEHPPDWVTEAIEKATRLEKRNLSYVEGILNGWKREGKNNGRIHGQMAAGNEKGQQQKFKAGSTGVTIIE